MFYALIKNEERGWCKIQDKVNRVKTSEKKIFLCIKPVGLVFIFLTCVVKYLIFFSFYSSLIHKYVAFIMLQELQSFHYDEEDYEGLPFDFHGGYVGYIG